MAGCGRTKVTHAQWVKGQGEEVEVWERHHDPIQDGEADGGMTKRCYYRNVMTCGSAWECPSCVGRHRRAGAAKVKLAVERWQGGHEGVPAHGKGSVLFLTLTVRHGLGDDLRVVRKGVTDAFSRMIAGEAWAKFRSLWSTGSRDYQDAVDRGEVLPRDGVQFVCGFVRALETTHGLNGWHPHVHALVFCLVPPSERTLDWMRRWFTERWRAAVRAALGAEHEPDDAHGVDLRACHDAGYLSKMGLELSSSATKEGRKAAHRPPFQIAIDYATTHNATDGKLWQAYCAGMKGAKMLTWSGGFASMASALHGAWAIWQPLLRSSGPANSKQ